MDIVLSTRRRADAAIEKIVEMELLEPASKVALPKKVMQEHNIYFIVTEYWPKGMNLPHE